MRGLNKYLVGLLFLISLIACNTGRRATPQPQFSNLYDSKSQTINADFKLYHSSSDSSIIYFSLRTGELLYTRYSNELFAAKFRVGYQIIDPASNAILDSNSQVFNDKKKETNQHLIQGKMSFRSAFNQTYDIIIYLQDLNRPSQTIVYEEFDRNRFQNRQSFLMKNELGKVIPGNIITSEEALSIESQLIQSDSLYLKHFDFGSELPLPPFSSGTATEYEPQSENVTSLPFSGKGELKLTKDGVYRVYTDPKSEHSFTLLKFSNSFPEVKSTDLFCKPLRYLTSKDEYAQIDTADIPKDVAESYWLKWSGSKTFAREAIRAYYKRVEEANRYFSTFNEGWATDRGLILIIFGPPERIMKQFKREYWYYGQEATGATLSFSFRKVDHPFSDNVYELERSPGYKSHWYRALDSWRAGRPYRAR